ncbi:nitroreductase family protein [uncultured Dialister sp.]|uniref:nitroreductase family protein n=1 Tax=uncultured Dialister sp. TaxID=278064 RepID=UPI0025CDA437|nr:nitroreductase family protein [uncultured Dialister sp.]
MEFEKVQSLRKSIRSYTKEAVSEEDRKALIHAALTASVGKHNDKGYVIVSVTDRKVLEKISTEGGEKLGRPHLIYEAPLLFLICRTKDAFEYLEDFDAGIIAEHIHLKATELGLGSIILFGFVRHLGAEADYLKMLSLPEGVTPLLGVAVGHSRLADTPRKEDRHFEVIER